MDLVKFLVPQYCNVPRGIRKNAPVVIMPAGLFSPISSILREHIFLRTGAALLAGTERSKDFRYHCRAGPRSRLGMIEADMGRVPFWPCRNLSLIVPLYGRGEITAED
jgi:hypothetical protein